MYSDILFDILSRKYSDILPDNLSGIYSGILWHSLLTPLCSGPGPAQRAPRYEMRRRADAEVGEKRRQGEEDEKELHFC